MRVVFTFTSKLNLPGATDDYLATIECHRLPIEPTTAAYKNTSAGSVETARKKQPHHELILGVWCFGNTPLEAGIASGTTLYTRTRGEESHQRLTVLEVDCFPC